MSRKPENTFRNSVHKHLPEDLPYHMKTHNPFRGGVFDDWYSGTAADMWIEYKYMTHIPKSDAVRLTLSPLQIDWGKRRAAEGRKMWVVLGLKLGGIIFHIDEIENTFTQRELLPRILTREALALWIQQQTVRANERTKSTAKRRHSGKRVLSRRVDELADLLPRARNSRTKEANS